MDKDNKKKKRTKKASKDAAAVIEEVENTEAVEEDADVADAKAAKDASKKKKKKKLPLTLGVIGVVIVALVAGVLIWHEQPSFCNAICHTPMDPYYRTYGYEPGQAAQDKWENNVSNANAMMVVSHKVNGVDCLGCHVPTLGEQITEGISWVLGDYDFPLFERTADDLVEARNLTSDDFCLNDACHHVTSSGKAITTRADLIAATSNLARNVHDSSQHGELACTTCHKAHRASIIYCSQCHTDVTYPAGWLSYADSLKLKSPSPDA